LKTPATASTAWDEASVPWKPNALELNPGAFVDEHGVTFIAPLAGDLARHGKRWSAVPWLPWHEHTDCVAESGSGSGDTFGHRRLPRFASQLWACSSGSAVIMVSADHHCVHVQGTYTCCQFTYGCGKTL